MNRLTERKLANMRSRAQEVEGRAAERERQRAVAEMVATPLGQAVVSMANALVRAFQPGAWSGLPANASREV